MHDLTRQKNKLTQKTNVFRSCIYWHKLKFQNSFIFDVHYKMNVSDHENEGDYIAIWQVGCKFGCKNGSVTIPWFKAVVNFEVINLKDSDIFKTIFVNATTLLHKKSCTMHMVRYFHALKFWHYYFSIRIQRTVFRPDLWSLKQSISFRNFLT